MGYRQNENGYVRKTLAGKKPAPIPLVQQKNTFLGEKLVAVVYRFFLYMFLETLTE
jgi:hypothetical protein